MEANTNKDLVTFYNDEEGWEFSTPIEPLLKNKVFSAMIDGIFKEGSTKKIQLPDFSRSVVERFIGDLAKGTTLPNMLLITSDAVRNIEHTHLARIAHRFQELQLVDVYISELSYLLSRTGNTKEFDASVYYEFYKVVHELSVQRFYTHAAKCLDNQPDGLFEQDDHILLKTILKRTNQPQSYFNKAVKFQAYRCAEVLLNEVPLDDAALSCGVSDITLPEHLILLLLEKYPKTMELAAHRNYSFWNSRSTRAIGIILRLHPNNFSFWHRAFENGYMEVIKFSPKDILIANNGDQSFGMVAVSKGWINCVELLLSEGWKPPTVALTTAARYQNPTFLKILLSHGVKPDCYTISAASLRGNMSGADTYSHERWACLDLIERSVLDNALHSELYQVYSASK